MRIQKDIEAKFRFELTNKHQQLELTSDQLYESKRQLELLKVAHESLKFESEKYVQDMRTRSKEEINELAEENHRLQLLVDE
jgi:transcription initiation factor TFIID subunit TAF12